MATIEMEEYVERPVLPVDSILHLKIMSAKTVDVPGRTPDTAWTKLEFTFKILGIQVTGDGSPTEAYEGLIGETIRGAVPFRLTNSSENRLKQWCEAAFNQELGVGFQLDTELLENRQVRGITGRYNKRATNPKTGQPYQQHEVSSLLALGGSMPPPAQQQNGWGAPASAAAAGPLVAPPPQQAPQQQTAVQTAVQTQPQGNGWGDVPPDDVWGDPNSDDPPF